MENFVAGAVTVDQKETWMSLIKTASLYGVDLSSRCLEEVFLHRG